MPWQPTYASVAEMKAYTRIGDTDDDAQIALALEAASRSIDQFTNRQFGQTALEARIYTARFERRWSRWVIDIDDIQDLTGLTIFVDADDDQTYDQSVDSFRMQPFNAPAKNRPFTEIVVKSDSTNLPNREEGGVEVTALFGWSFVPDAIKQACLFQANRNLKRRDAAFGVAGSPEIGSELRLLDRLDPDVAVSIRPYQRWWAAA